jgi:UDP-N-acetylmuramyl tripeptide synthase
MGAWSLNPGRLVRVACRPATGRTALHAPSSNDIRTFAFKVDAVKAKTAAVSFCGNRDPAGQQVSRTADLIVFRFLTLATRLTLGDLDPIYFPNCVRIYPTVNSTGGDLAARPVISLGNRQGGNGPTGVCTWILESCQTAAQKGAMFSTTQTLYNFYCFSEIRVQNCDPVTSDTDCTIKWRAKCLALW